MQRLWIILGLAIGVLACWDTPREVARAASGSSTLDLKNLLEKGLKAGQPDQVDFIGAVLAKVEAGELPESLVRATFLWAKQKPVNQFQYFQFGIRERAKKLGVSL